MNLISVILTSFVFSFATFSHAANAKFTATKNYDVAVMNGFLILFSPEVNANSEVKAAVVTELEKQIDNISKTLPPDKTKELRQTKIWVEFNADPNGAAVFHVSKRWLKENGYNPDKASSIEIANAQNFVNWTKQNQPSMLLHELAHAFHNKHRDKIGAAIENAFMSAVKSKSYEIVSYNLGGKQKAYAINSSDEYFAELTEAYFGENDYYPFNKAELATRDPKGFELMKKAWGK